MIFSKIPSCEEKSSIADVRMGFEYNPYIISLTSDIILLKLSLHDTYTVQRCILQTCEISVTKLFTIAVNHFSANFTKWSNILKQIRQQFVDELLECVWPFCGIGGWRVNYIEGLTIFGKRLIIHARQDPKYSSPFSLNRHSYPGHRM